MDGINKKNNIFRKSASAALFLFAITTMLFFASGCTKTPITTKAIIVPHHLLVENYIDDFYKQISEKNPNIEKIILVSPNHFDFGNRYIQSTTSLPGKDGKQINLAKNEIAKLSQTGAFSIEPKYFEKEHGIINEIIFTNKYFQNAKIIPIRIKNGTPKDRLDMLINELSKITTQNTLIVVSADFTHYTDEKIALENDKKFIKYFENLDKTKEINFDEIKKLATTENAKTENENSENYPVALDSPESLYTALKLLQKQDALTFAFYKRTSSASLLGTKNPLENTSHIFGEFLTK
ncbi:MAG: AmmeMemoRadiSam system protein B [Candidatus Gracilibacteria bacterium]|jgi:AmmeMemoRadiSam system protein B